MFGRIVRIARTPVTLLILLGILCYGAYWGYTNVLAPVPPAPPEPCINQNVKDGKLESSQVTVSIFNGGDRKGLAGDVGRAMRKRGFKVDNVTNTAEKVQETVIVGAKTDNPEVKFVKTFFKKAKVRADGRADHSVDILVGNKYGGFNSKAKTTYKVKARTVCLPDQGSSPSVELGG